MGIALSSAFLTQREQLHSNRIGELVSAYSPLTRDRLDMSARGFVAHGFDP